MFYKLIWQGVIAVIVVGAGAACWQAYAQEKPVQDVAQALFSDGHHSKGGEQREGRDRRDQKSAHHQEHDDDDE